MSTKKTLLLNLIITIFLIPIIYGFTFFIFNVGTKYVMKKSFNREYSHIEFYNNEFAVSKMDQVEIASGSRVTTYMTLWYDCRNADVRIDGVLPANRHWNIVPYDLWTSLPLNSWMDENSLVINDDSSYSVLLTTNTDGRENAIDVSESPKGLVILRLTNAEDMTEIIRYKPEVSEI